MCHWLYFQVQTRARDGFRRARREEKIQDADFHLSRHKDKGSAASRVSIQKSETITVLNKMDPSSPQALQESNGKNGKHLLKLQVTLPSVCLVSSKTQFHVIL